MGERARRTALGLAVAVVIGFSLSGCGGGDSDDRVTKAEYLEQANALCEKAIQRREEDVRVATKEADQKGDLSMQERLAYILEAATPEFTKMVRELEELPPPEGDKQLKTVIDGYKEIANKLEREPVDFPLWLLEKAKHYGLVECY